MLKILGDFDQYETRFKNGQMSFEDYQDFFSNARRNGIDGSVKPFAVGGSDAAIIFGVSPWDSPKSLIMKKMDPAAYKEVITPEKRRILDLGHHMEEGIARMCAERLQDSLKTKVELIPSTLQYLDTRYPHCIADIDYLARIRGRIYLIEVKSARPYSKSTELFQMGGVPVYYLYQVQYYMEVLKDMDIAGAYLFAGWGFDPENDYAEIFISRNQEQGERILEGCEQAVKMAAKGMLPSNDNVANPDVLKASNAVLYGSKDPDNPAKQLKGVKAETLLHTLSEVNAALKANRAQLREIRGREATPEENTIKKEQEMLEAEKERLTGELLQMDKDCDGAYLKGKERDYVMSVTRDFSVDKSVKEYIRDKYPDVYADISKVAPKISVNVNIKERSVT